MRRDTALIQIALLFIGIAILWVLIYDRQTATVVADQSDQQIVAQPFVEWVQQQWGSTWTASAVGWGPVITNSYTERVNSNKVNLVKSYFAAIAEKNYTRACSLMTNGKCAESRPWAVENFSTEFEKFVNGYEYTAVRDLWIVAPSGRDVVCVKYSYRYQEDTNPWLVSEIMSFYLEDDGTQLRISDRVCEKKYKEGRGERPCPIEPNARFCEGRIY